MTGALSIAQEHAPQSAARAGWPAASSDVAAVHYLRAVAALSVTLHHLVAAAGGRVPGLATFGVDIFFVVSGFILPYSMYRSGYGIGDYPRFIARRLARLEPAYLASVVLCAGLAYAATLHPDFQGRTPMITGEQLIAHVLYAVPLTEHDWVNISYWTLAYEFAFYLGIGLLFPLCVRGGVLFAAAGGACLLAAALIFAGNIEIHRVALFLFGAAAFRTFCGLDARGTLVLNLATISLLVLSMAQHASGGVGASVLATCIVGIAATAWLLSPVRPPAPSVLFLSQISYSLYLVHVPIGTRVVHIGERLIGGAAGEVIAVGAALAVSVLAAALWYRLFEVPGLRLARRLARAPATAGLVPAHGGQR